MRAPASPRAIELLTVIRHGLEGGAETYDAHLELELNGIAGQRGPCGESAVRNRPLQDRSAREAVMSAEQPVSTETRQADGGRRSQVRSALRRVYKHTAHLHEPRGQLVESAVPAETEPVARRLKKQREGRAIARSADSEEVRHVG